MRKLTYTNLTWQMVHVFVLPLLLLSLIVACVYMRMYFSLKTADRLEHMSEALNHTEMRLKLKGESHARHLLLQYYSYMDYDSFITDGTGRVILGKAPDFFRFTSSNKPKEAYFSLMNHRLYVVMRCHSSTTENWLFLLVPAYTYTYALLVYLVMMLMACALGMVLSFVLYHRLLQPKVKQLIGSEERMVAELNIAHDVQMQMLPQNGVSVQIESGIQVFADLLPAREVGGDLYDYFQLSTESNKLGKLFFCVGDVSDKGVPASLMMAVTKSLFQKLARMHFSLSTIVSELNASYSSNNPTNMFCTFFAGCLDLSTLELQFINAGHNAPLLNGQVLSVKPNLPLGAVANCEFQQQTVQLKKSDMLLLYTDGITEAINSSNQFFGVERLLSGAANPSGQSVQTYCEQILQSVLAFRGNRDQNDDMTILALKL